MRRSFNPLPSRKTGETAVRQVRGVAQGGSIHSRLGRREKQNVVELFAKAGVFQSTPVSEDGRNGIGCWNGGRPTRFQSTPVSEDGRNGPAGGARHAAISFNPLPSRKTGET